VAAHRDEMAQSIRLGFARVGLSSTLDPVPLPIPTLPADCLGMGPTCPFPDSSLAFVVLDALTKGECGMLIEEASVLLASGEQYVYTLVNSVREVVVHHLPGTLGWFNSKGVPHLAGAAAEYFLDVVNGPGDLWVYNVLMIHYKATSSKTHAPLHRDSSLITLVVPLLERAEYEG